MKKIKCLLCGSMKSKTIHVVDSRNPKIKGLKIARCNSCMFVYMNPQPSIKQIMTFYPRSLNESKRKSKLRIIKEHYESLRLKTVLHEFNKKPDNLLDIGCSNGFFLKKAEEKGIEIYGTELGDEQIDYLKKNITRNIYHSEEELIGKIKFDAITAFDVIEHLPHPDKFLENCSKLLRPNGRLVILTPALDSWSYNTFKERVGWLGDQHLFYFRRDDMRKILNRYGFELYKIKTYNKSALHTMQFAYSLLTGKKIEFCDNLIFFAKLKKSRHHS